MSRNPRQCTRPPVSRVWSPRVPPPRIGEASAAGRNQAPNDRGRGIGAVIGPVTRPKGIVAGRYTPQRSTGHRRTQCARVIGSICIPWGGSHPRRVGASPGRWTEHPARIDSGRRPDHPRRPRSADQRQVWALRRSLIEIGLLPLRNESLERLTPYLRDVVGNLKVEHRQLVSTYGTWWVLRRARRELERTGRFTLSQKRSAQRRLSAAAAFLEWLDDQGTTLAGVKQAEVDRWLDVDDFHRADVADFLRWARRRRQGSRCPRAAPRLASQPHP